LKSKFNFGNGRIFFQKKTIFLIPYLFPYEKKRMDWSAIVKILPNLGAAGLVTLIAVVMFFWLFWKFIPRIQDDHNAAMQLWHTTHDQAVRAFTDALAGERQAFTDELARQRQQADKAAAVAAESAEGLQRSMDRLAEAVTLALTHARG